MKKTTKILLVSSSIVVGIGVIVGITYGADPSLFVKNEQSYFLGEVHDEAFYSTLGNKIAEVYENSVAEQMSKIQGNPNPSEEELKVITDETNENSRKSFERYYRSNKILCYEILPIGSTATLQLNEDTFKKLYDSYNTIYNKDTLTEYENLSKEDEEFFKSRISTSNSGEYKVLIKTNSNVALDVTLRYFC